MDPTSSSTSALAKTENYLFFDPRSSSARRTTGNPTEPAPLGPHGRPITGGPAFRQWRQGFAEAVAFTVGSSNMEE